MEKGPDIPSHGTVTCLLTTSFKEKGFVYIHSQILVVAVLV